MELTSDEALQKGIEAHKAGNAIEADRYYTAILKANPRHPDANHNMGVLAVGIGKVEAALPFFKTALEVNSAIGQYWLSYIDALIKLDRIADAKAALDQAKRKGAQGYNFDQTEKRLSSSNSPNFNAQEPSQQQLQSLISLHTQGQYQESKNHSLQLLKKFSGSVTLYNILGAANHSLGNLDAAIEAFQKALSIMPNYSDAYSNIGVTLEEQGKLDEAIEACNKALSIKPDYPEAHINIGNVLKKQGKLDEAIEAYSKALSIRPDYAEAHINMGNVLKKKGKLDEAIQAYNEVLSIKPDYAEAYNNMGITLQEQGKLDEAIQAYNEVLSIKPDYAEAYINMGNALTDLSKQEEAIEAYSNALTIKPDYAEAYINMGNAFTDQGKLDEAIEAYNKALSIKPDYAEAHRSLSLICTCTANDPRLLQVRNLLNVTKITDEARCNLNFALTKMYEDLGELDKAFQHLSEGNALRKKLLNYNIDQDEKLFSKLKNAEANISKNRIKIKKVSTDITPIFILGMPRSGTTLVEQIISSHSEVTGAGELGYVERYGLKLATGDCSIDNNSASEFREKYLLELSKVSNGKKIITDKMPKNFQFIPLICATLPEAKIIHIKRNPSATAWSNYRHYFPTKDLGYCYNINDVISYYRLYSDLMASWISEYGDRIYNLSYEKLTTNQENEIRALIKHLNLAWEYDCMLPHKNRRSVKTASQQQVRQKIYKGSSHAWLKYELYLNGVFDSFNC